MLQALNDYPRWLVIVCATVVGAVGVWVLGKLLRAAIGILLVAVLVGGTAWALWTLVKS